MARLSTMAHGFAGPRNTALSVFAQAFAAAGFVVLVHDHRNFGTSGGDLRGDVDPWRQIADWRRAISYLEGRPEVDPSLLGVSARKGTSCTFSGIAPSKKSDTCSAAHTVEPAREGSGASGETQDDERERSRRFRSSHAIAEPASSSSSGPPACGRDRMKTAFCVFDTQARCPR